MKRPTAQQFLNATTLARIFEVDARVVKAWLDDGKLRGHLLPGTAKGWRVSVADALSFAAEHNVNSPTLRRLGRELGLVPAEMPAVLLVTPDPVAFRYFVGAGLDASATGSVFKGTEILAARQFRACVVDDSVGRVQAAGFCRYLGDRRPGLLIGRFLLEDGEGAETPPRLWSLTPTWRHPVDYSLVARELRSLLARRTGDDPPAKPHVLNGQANGHVNGVPAGR